MTVAKPHSPVLPTQEREKSSVILNRSAANAAAEKMLVESRIICVGDVQDTATHLTAGPHCLTAATQEKLGWVADVDTPI